MRTKTELDSLILDDKCFVGLFLPERQSLSQALIAASIVALTVKLMLVDLLLNNFLKRYIVLFFKTVSGSVAPFLSLRSIS